MTGARLLVLGDTGLAGAAIVAEARRRGMAVTGASRHGEFELDLRDPGLTELALAVVKPDLIINAAAIVSVADCERDPKAAWEVNTRPAGLIADYAARGGARVIHISTDHFWSGDGRAAHGEDAPVMLLNAYAHSKHEAEALALTHADTLVVRTNILGVRSATGASFGEWALDVISTDGEATLFDDQFVSTLDVWVFAAALLDLAATEMRGVINLAAREVFSKAELVQALATAMGRTLTRAKTGSVSIQGVRRPDSLGLDVRRAEAALGRRLPTLAEVATAFAAHAEPVRSEAHALGH